LRAAHLTKKQGPEVGGDDQNVLLPAGACQGVLSPAKAGFGVVAWAVPRLAPGANVFRPLKRASLRMTDPRSAKRKATTGPSTSPAKAGLAQDDRSKWYAV
jgi:hypothetical protein